MTNLTSKINPSYKVIADHLRSSAFLIADGVLPSNEGRGYVLRRIMRRAMRHIHMLGTNEAAMYKLFPALEKEMGQAYPELNRARDVIIETLKNEEERFRTTLGRGMEILNEELGKIKKGEKFSGNIAFKLYDTYGFPLDLTEDILREKNITVDIQSFDQEMEMQRERARKSWSGSGEAAEDKIFFELKEKFGDSKFLGYENLSHKAKIVASLKINNQDCLILDQTPFYATSGGQKGDDGKIYLALDKNKFAQISETRKFAGNLFVHFVEEKNHDFKEGDEVTAEVNIINRTKRARNHSATHLMHKALKDVLGSSVTQKGSNVDSNYFTFDFNLNRAMTEEELLKIEDLVNFYIRQNSPAKTELMDLEEAKASGAEALFGEKYDSKVRVVSMSPSIELCGGTHVKATGDIGIFKILSEKGIAAGIRRIEAVTGKEAIDFYRNQKSKLENEIEALKQESKKKDKEIDKLKKEKLSGNDNNLTSEKIREITLTHHYFEGVNAKDLRDLATGVKNKNQHHSVILFFGEFEGKITAILALSQDLTAKFDASKIIGQIVEKLDGKGGGGKPDFAMGGGSNKDGIKDAILVIKEILQGN